MTINKNEVYDSLRYVHKYRPLLEAVKYYITEDPSRIPDGMENEDPDIIACEIIYRDALNFMGLIKRDHLEHLYPDTDSVMDLILKRENQSHTYDKRNAPPPGTSTGGCYVATCVYGSYDCPEVWTLRRYRDYTLARTFFGRAFIRVYYATSPTLVKWFGKTAWFRKLVKPMLDKLTTKLQREGVASTPYDDITW